MEEASLDHGLDRLPLFFLLFFFLQLPAAFATTFGPISVSNQVENAQYVVRGRIVGSSWVMEERQSRRPYTHWKLHVIEQSKGDSLGQEVVIRQPGGELGGLGYHVAGTAQFRDGEEVFVNLRDTDEAGVKEVMGLASGKYTVERGADGKQQLRSGLGFIVKDESGRPFSPDTFVALVKRIVEGKATEEDRSVFVTKEVTHDQPTISHSHTPPKEVRKPAPSAAPEKQESPQEFTPASEEPEGTSAGFWIAFSLLGLAVLVGIAWLWKR